MIRIPTSVPTGIESDLSHFPSDAERMSPEEGYHFSLRQQHLKLIQVQFHDRTDTHNELVFENEWLLHTTETELSLAGNVFVIEDVLSGAGRVLLKPEPLPHARPYRQESDLRVTPRKDSGFDFDVLYPAGTNHPEVIEIPYEGGAFGRIQALHQFQIHQRLEESPQRTPSFISNTWGDRSRDRRIQHDFIEQEILAGARLGVEVVQIDDGWMRGVTKNSARAAGGGGVWEGFWNQDANFWQTSPERFPRGLEPLVEMARQRGMGMGLWFGPDSWNDFANWRRDADCLLDFYRRLGIAHFKLDGIRMDSLVGQANLNRFFEAVLRESKGQIVLDLDVTAQTRPGYFGALQAGVIFVENRYTDWHRYWPHQTLRNLWKLARWVDPRRLRMEFLNNTRNQDKYPDDPLAPAAYTPDALFASVMAANPLGWFEVSNLPESYFERAAPLIKTWKQVRAEFFGGAIIPVGSAPDGVSWTGFSSVDEDWKSGFLLLFRELSPERQHIFQIPGIGTGAMVCERLAGTGELAWTGTGFSVEIPEKLGFIFARFEVEK